MDLFNTDGVAGAGVSGRSEQYERNAIRFLKKRGSVLEETPARSSRTEARFFKKPRTMPKEALSGLSRPSADHVGRLPSGARRRALDRDPRDPRAPRHPSVG